MVDFDIEALTKKAWIKWHSAMNEEDVCAVPLIFSRGFENGYYAAVKQINEALGYDMKPFCGDE